MEEVYLQMNQALKTSIIANRPTIYWGDPGVGKTEEIKQISSENIKGPCVVFIPATAEPTDLG